MDDNTIVNFIQKFKKIPLKVEDFEFPDFEFFRVPEDHQYVSWNRQENNFAQAIEGGIDSAHSNFLHSTLDAYWRTDAWLEQGKRSGVLRDVYHARDQHPKFFAEDTDYGVATGSRRETGEDDFYGQVETKTKWGAGFKQALKLSGEVFKK